METFLICYDLNKPGANYDSLYQGIKDISNNWWHYLDSTWIIKTNYSALQIREKLRPLTDSNDELLVIEATSKAAWAGFNQKGSDWLKENL